jgi:hypothetical protein
MLVFPTCNDLTFLVFANKMKAYQRGNNVNITQVNVLAKLTR